ncbi:MULTISPECIES: hypothetical protein [Pseudomonas]|uniref:hypothetical protein n=1 Tax=Pseudomonas TaxID=286 RepID=UPI001D68CE2F|nr:MULTISPECIES: hypothetical protein [Pseudomonas]HJE70320.1 hypothetical protein [Pseudomonas oryzihabitans]
MQINIISDRKSMTVLPEAVKDGDFQTSAFHRSDSAIFEGMFQEMSGCPPRLVQQ